MVVYGGVIIIFRRGFYLDMGSGVVGGSFLGRSYVGGVIRRTVVFR